MERVERVGYRSNAVYVLADMNSNKVCAILNQVIALHARSLPVYLRDAAPWIRQEAADARATLDAIADDQLLTVNRLADYVQELDGAVDMGSFPMHYAGWHDLSLDFLLDRATENQVKAVANLEAIVSQLDGDPKAKALVEESLGAAKAHLDTLADLSNSVAS